MFEALDEPGGQLAIAALASWRRDLIGIVRWLVDELEILGVEIRYNSYAEAGDIKDLSPDVIIIATGGLADTEICTGAQHVLSVVDALTNPDQVGKKVLVFDDHGDHQALSCVQALAEAGSQVELVTPDGAVGEELGLSNTTSYYTAFANLGIRTTLNTRLLAVTRDADRLSATLKNDYGGNAGRRYCGS
jgi:pyruvate/2-oxoglutarate dehydrogenase complex dihydrolipoamide dehydrogenase (E3) component